MENWTIKESENYIFHYHKNSIAEKSIYKIIEEQEYCLNHITKVLGVELNMKINYYLCNSPQEVGILYGDNEPCNAFARKPNNIYAVYNEDVQCIGYHEDSHIISYVIAIPPQVFVREGLAMYFDKNHWGVNNLSWVSFFINKNIYVSIIELMANEGFYKHPWNITYPIAGAFTDYIITIYGIDKYLEFYKLVDIDFNVRFKNVFDIDIEEAEKNFIRYIKSLKISKELFNLLETLL